MKPNFVQRDLLGDPIEFWVLATSQPEIGSDGKVRYVILDDKYLKRPRTACLEKAKRLEFKVEKKIP